MKLAGRIAAVALTASVTFTIFGGSVSSRATTVPGPCHLTPRAGESVRHRMKRIITCAVGLWSVPGGAKRAICIADRESHLNPIASSATGKYLGLFQHSAAAWPSRFKTYTRPRWELRDNALNGRSNTVVTIRMVHAGGRHGWRPWAGPGC
jgi:hypothetical protein